MMTTEPLLAETDESFNRVEVEYFSNERTFKQRLNYFFFNNRQSSFCIRIIIVILKLLTCVCYILRVCKDRGPAYAKCYGCHTEYADLLNITKDEYAEHPQVNYFSLIWVDRPFYLWIIQVVLSFISLIRTTLLFYLWYKGNLIQVILTPIFFLECVTSIPCLLTVLSPKLRNLYLPMFLNCWTARLALVNLVNDLHRVMQKSQSAVSQHLIVLGSTIACLVFTTSCGIQHIQRAGRMNINMFQGLYFSIVTLSTVGYGDFTPDIWLSQLLVIVIICVAFVIVPKHVEQLALTFIERQKCGGDYSLRRAKTEKHVVVCCTTMRSDTIYDFLNEFYAHPMLQDYFVLLLSPNELDTSMKRLLQVPMWSQRVIYMKGASLKDTDLERVRLSEAEAFFLLAPRNETDKNAADQHTILRSWAARDHSPKCPQYVQIFRPENKLHVRHAEYVVCEDEFKYALLANNCICPGISTLITLLLHTSQGKEGQKSKEEWHRIYGKYSGNEIYHIKVSQSKLLNEYIGKSFTHASFHAHRKYGIGLIAVKDTIRSIMQLNPGPKHIIKSTDICYYVSMTEENLMALTERIQIRKRTTNVDIERSPCISKSLIVTAEEDTFATHVVDQPNVEYFTENSIALEPKIGPQSIVGTDRVETDNFCPICGTVCEEMQYYKGFPPVAPYIGTSATCCYLLKLKKKLCCLQLAQTCAHCSYVNANEYKWKNPAIILAADHANCGIYNFVVPLRAHYMASHKLNPIIMLLETPPPAYFLDCLSYFPMIYWMQGRIENIDNLLRAGILLSQHFVVVNRDGSAARWSLHSDDDYLADGGTMVSVQTMSRFFPRIRLVTELSHAANMRFMQFDANDVYALQQSKMEKTEKERGSHMAFMFRLPFAAGNVFSAAMLDTLLYQAFVKDYLIQFARLLLGIDQALGSGYLMPFEIGPEQIFLKKYGRLYEKLCVEEGDIPIGIYRTIQKDASKENVEGDALFTRQTSCKYSSSEKHEIEKMVRNRLLHMDLPTDDYAAGRTNEKRTSLSYVIINPSHELQLELGDIIYIIKSNKNQLQSISAGPQGQIVHCEETMETEPENDTDLPDFLSLPKLTVTSSSPA